MRLSAAEQSGRIATTTGEGRRRLQFQLGKQFTAPLRFVMKNQDPPGVTTAQVDSRLLNLWNAAKTPAARFPFNSLQRDLRSAIIEVGRCAHRYPPGGVIGGSDEGGKSVCSAEVDKSG